MAYITDQVSGAELNTPTPPYFGTGLSTAVGVFGPPVCEGIKLGKRMAYFPVELWGYIIYPTFAQPEQDIGIEVVVVCLSRSGVATKAVYRGIAPHTKRAYTKAAFFVGLFYYPGQAYNNRVGIAAAPGIFGHALGILCIGFIIWKLLAGYAVGVKVIVHMYGIYGVAGYYVFYYGGYKFLCFFVAGVKIFFIAIGYEPVGVLAGGMHAGNVGVF